MIAIYGHRCRWHDSPCIKTVMTCINLYKIFQKCRTLYTKLCILTITIKILRSGPKNWIEEKIFTYFQHSSVQNRYNFWIDRALTAKQKKKNTNTNGQTKIFTNHQRKFRAFIQKLKKKRGLLSNDQHYSVRNLRYNFRRDSMAWRTSLTIT